ncbi:MAG: futalosine hydrolase [Actinomycetota bacterium]|nr:futalosine hydrolase [Actinomycetota bacterium]MDQ2957814.1 futalosine hydrolase [Actinomycetota bacterium]
MSRLLVVTAAPAELTAVLGDRPSAMGSVNGLQVHRGTTPAGLLDVVCGGVGPVAAALSSAALLAGASYDLVLSVGIGGGFAPIEAGAVVVADAVAHADLGAETADGGFSSLAELGWGPVRFEVDPALAAELARRTSAAVGTVLSVTTVTGTQARADRLRTDYPDALAEAMEGVGVCQAATRAGLPFGELRTISNRVGPRQRESWRIGEALAALTVAFDRLLAEPLDHR